MLFEELVEQHRVHCFIANRVNFPLCITNDEIGINFFNLLRDKAELRSALGIDLFLVTEGDRFERMDCFAGFVHWFYLILETLRARFRAEAARSGIYENSRTSGNSC